MFRKLTYDFPKKNLGNIYDKLRKNLRLFENRAPAVEFQYGGRFGEFNGMSSQSHVSHCRVLSLGEFTVTIPEPHATLQGVTIPSAILKIVFQHILFYLRFDELRLSYRLRYTCFHTIKYISENDASSVC